MEPHLRKLYPNVKRIEWTANVVRGGSKLGDQPRALGPHLDYHQNDSMRLDYHKNEWEPLDGLLTNFMVLNKTEPHYLMGIHDTEDAKLGVLLGVWKPLEPEEVCDYPLAVMDAQTMAYEDQHLNKVSINFGLVTFNFLSATIKHSPKQKWYYYPYQNTREVLIFHQYSKSKLFANPHTSFFNKNCPEGTQKRISIENRVALFF